MEKSAFGLAFLYYKNVIQNGFVQVKIELPLRKSQRVK